MEDRWSGILSVLQVAHAMEILAKARIAQEHPLLLFDTYPKPTKRENRIINEMTLSQLSEKGRTIEWSSIIEMLWLVADMKTVDISAFNEFGEIRNAIQHFGIVSKEKRRFLSNFAPVYIWNYRPIHKRKLGPVCGRLLSGLSRRFRG